MLLIHTLNTKYVNPTLPFLIDICIALLKRKVVFFVVESYAICILSYLPAQKANILSFN